jgi:hypothetical protein
LRGRNTAKFKVLHGSNGRLNKLLKISGKIDILLCEKLREFTNNMASDVFLASDPGTIIFFDRIN